MTAVVLVKEVFMPFIFDDPKDIATEDTAPPFLRGNKEFLSSTFGIPLGGKLDPDDDKEPEKLDTPAGKKRPEDLGKTETDAEVGIASTEARAEVQDGDDTTTRTMLLADKKKQAIDEIYKDREGQRFWEDNWGKMLATAAGTALKMIALNNNYPGLFMAGKALTGAAQSEFQQWNQQFEDKINAILTDTGVNVSDRARVLNYAAAVVERDGSISRERANSILDSLNYPQENRESLIAEMLQVTPSKESMTKKGLKETILERDRSTIEDKIQVGLVETGQYDTFVNMDEKDALLKARELAAQGLPDESPLMVALSDDDMMKSVVKTVRGEERTDRVNDETTEMVVREEIPKGAQYTLAELAGIEAKPGFMKKTMNISDVDSGQFLLLEDMPGPFKFGDERIESGKRTFGELAARIELNLVNKTKLEDGKAVVPFAKFGNQYGHGKKYHNRMVEVLKNPPKRSSELKKAIKAALVDPSLLHDEFKHAYHLMLLQLRNLEE
jgi:hypothetical protein